MKKKIIVISLIFFLTFTCCGCGNHEENIENEKVYLTSKYYNNGNFLEIVSTDLEKLENETYILYTYNPYCTFEIPCDEIFKAFMQKYKIDFLSMPFSEFKKTQFYETIKYGPTIVIVDNGKIIDYLDANSNDDLIKYQKTSAFESWIKKSVFIADNKK